MNRKFRLLATTALTTSTALMSGAAVAADARMPVKARPAAPPPFSWTRCYVGGNVGGAWANIDQSVQIPGRGVFSSSGTGSGVTGGVQAGCDWQYTSNWVLGLEGDVNFLNLSRRHDFGFTVTGEDTAGSQVTKLRWMTTVRAVLGIAMGPSLLYGTGGVAIGDVDSSVSAISSFNGTATLAGSRSETLVGYIAGGGWEYPFAPGLSAKIEGLFFDLGRVDYPVVTVSGATNPPSTWSADAKVTGVIVRAGINLTLGCPSGAAC